VILGLDEISRFFENIANLKHRDILITIYAAGLSVPKSFPSLLAHLLIRRNHSPFLRIHSSLPHDIRQWVPQLDCYR
jgi:hypothetical protein